MNYQLLNKYLIEALLSLDKVNVLKRHFSTYGTCTTSGTQNDHKLG